MSANSNETKLSVEGSPEAATEATQTSSPAAHRRQALSLSLVGGMAAFLAACGKYVTRFDDQAGRNKGLGTGAGKIGEGEGNAKPGTGAVGGGGAGDPGAGGGGGGVVPPGGGGPGTPGICINTSGAVAKTPAQILAVSSSGVPIYALYGNNFSALLAIKLKKSAGDGEVAVAENDVVHILAKKSATESMLLASRRVRPADIYSNGVGLIFESLSLSAVATTAIEILIVKGGMKEGMHYKAELSKTFSNTFMSKPVYHLGELNQDPAKSDITFDLDFGKENEAPTLAETSSIGVPQSLGKLFYDAVNDPGTYVAATNLSTWNVNSVVAPSAIPEGDRAVTNIFGETITPSGSLFREHQSLVVYVRKNRSVGGKTYDVYLRYFIYIG